MQRSKDNSNISVNTKTYRTQLSFAVIGMNSQIVDKKVETNSTLGKAISYTLKNWEKLTRFLTIPGAPLDNNVCERAIKTAICHRKNSLFYKNEHGAYIGDMFMSLIYTCHLNEVNAFDYLTQLQKHSSDVFKNPSQWMPWNYKENLKLEQSVKGVNFSKL
ncbi:transposase, partial [Candidatus Magnetomorum sp. HK-1]